MMPCCGYAYVQFRNADGSTNWTKLSEWAIAKVVARKPRHREAHMDALIAMQVMEMCLSSTCGCDCHTVGSCLFH